MNPETSTPLEADASVETPELAGPPAPSRVQSFFADLRHAGAHGQAQWQRWIDGFRQRRAVTATAESQNAAEAPLAKRLLDSPQLMRAQQRGASLLLRFASAARAQAEHVERALATLGQPSAVDATA